MNHWSSLSRMTRATLLVLAFGCAPALHAQETASPPPQPRSLPGVADIEFSLRGRQVEDPGTPTEGLSLRPSPTRAPAEAAPASAAASPAPVRGDGGGSEPARASAPPPGAPSPRGELADRPADDTPVAQTPAFEAAPETSQGQAVTDAATPPLAKETSTGAIPAWPFGLAALALAIWFAFRRRKPTRAVSEHGEPDAPAIQPQAAAEPTAPPVADAEPEPPQAHPSLRVKLAGPVAEHSEPAPSRDAPQPAVPPVPAVTRYDAFGRPIAAQPVAPPAPPPPPPKPKARIVRYNAMGLPILD